MERFSDNTYEARREKFAMDFYRDVGFVFDKRQIPSAAEDDPVNRYCNLVLSNEEVQLVSSHFTDRFIDAPESIEIFIVGINPNLYKDADQAGLQITTKHAGDDGVYSTLYRVWFDGAGSEHIIVSKDSYWIGAIEPGDNRGIFNDAMRPSRTIFDNVAIGEDELEALTGMIAEL